TVCPQKQTKSSGTNRPIGIHEIITGEYYSPLREYHNGLPAKTNRIGGYQSPDRDETKIKRANTIRPYEGITTVCPKQ
ncbi:MAG: hypothetical protein IKH65_01420, partial [Clostridia bacterium]|nr:hypothetical protein [Clostridia bacterium]